MGIRRPATRRTAGRIGGRRRFAFRSTGRSRIRSRRRGCCPGVGAIGRLGFLGAALFRCACVHAGSGIRRGRLAVSSAIRGIAALALFRTTLFGCARICARSAVARGGLTCTGAIRCVGDLCLETSDVIQKMNFFRHAVRVLEDEIAHSEVFGDCEVWFKVEPCARVRQVIEFTRINRLATTNASNISAMPCSS